ncbi:MAG: 5'/3'-nucleotidase SurE [Hyphomicrobiaceae bacterium]|nr:5'/3'-nucleotidase SurE [Hyphomicrobiaceae bacterium]
MRILVTNDDGIDAPGLHALRQIAEELAGPSGEVWVSAPETNQSGAGHSLSLNEPLRMREIAERVYAVRGTPTDSVIMGARHVLKDRRPDLVLSGINRGANMAEDVTYSGTIAGALEGTQLGIRSIALSQAYSYGTGDFPHWETPIALAPALIRNLLAEEWPPLVLMNINFPDRRPDEVEGVMATVQGRRDQQNLGVEERRDTWGNPYYWLGYALRRSNPERGTDIWAVYNGWISVTPLSMNLTERAVHARLAERLRG